MNTDKYTSNSLRKDGDLGTDTVTPDSISIDEMTIRHTINNLRQLVKNSTNKAYLSLTEIHAKTLEGYLPEILKDYGNEVSKNE